MEVQRLRAQKRFRDSGLAGLWVCSCKGSGLRVHAHLPKGSGDLIASNFWQLLSQVMLGIITLRGPYNPSYLPRSFFGGCRVQEGSWSQSSVLQRGHRQ